MSLYPGEKAFVLASGPNTSRWLRMDQLNISYLQQAAWYIDAVNGNDNNAGSQSAPIQTLAEWASRINGGTLTPPIVLDPNGSGVTAAFVDVYLVSASYPQSDPLSFSVDLGPSAILRFWGMGQMTTYTGSITGALTAKAPATNVPWSFQDTAIPSTWTATLAASGGMGSRIRNTNVSRTGVITYAAKDLGSQTVRTSDWGARAILPNQVTINAASITPVVGDTYVVEQITKLWVGDIYLSGLGINNPSGTRSVVGFTDIDFQCPTGVAASSIFSDKILQWIMFSGCIWSQTVAQCNFGLYLGNFFFENCCFRARNLYAVACAMTWEQGLNLNFITPIVSGQIIYDGDFLNQGNPITCITGVDYRFAQLAVMDSGSHGVFLQPASEVSILNQRQNAHRLWGAGNGTYGVRTRGSSSLNYTTTIPTITGTSGDFLLGGSAVAWSFQGSNTPQFRPAAGLACTWANVAAAQSDTGFGGNAVNPGQNTGIFQLL